MKRLSSALLAASVLFSALPASAQEYRFTYSKLYTQMKNNANEGHDDVKVSFFFINKETRQLCNIEKAWMEKEEHYEELTIAPNNELLVPLDSNLRSANPLVFIHTQNDIQCDFSMVVMTKEPLNGKISVEELSQYPPQMKSLLDDLGGMFSKWFSPEVEGLTLEFANNYSGSITRSNGESIAIENGVATVVIDELSKDEYVTLPVETVRVLPFIPNAQ
ncbi:DUF2987 domain-containing protein [uncultured Vibrio sp.]|uniref:DUF2987 domain-containing protein n=1 Tax=uncultured Vibrio sp. TaxID=114054 RepID=UPI00092085AA|nr:DUF2987 domain-containing protein [uncultured Vibrio sp.]OIQ26345.1 MAG: hypothetical protein BM561_00855 [Vibrio sp. MedPE-SWchi]